MSITKDIWSPLLGSKIVSRTSKELTRSLLGVRTLMNPLLLRRGFPVVLLALALGLFALSPTIRAVDPPPDGGYPNSNTAEGDNALFNLTTGFNNTAIGFRALFNNTSGGFNTASGYQALFSNTTGNSNTATGSFALLFNTIGFQNTATGFDALFNNTRGIQNTATGVVALAHNTEGIKNTATGFNALGQNTIGSSNTATGVGALNRLTTGSSNTAEGQGALHHLITGSSNIALGFFAGANLTTGSNNIEIGNVGLASDANMIRIGKVGTQTATFVAGIRGVTVASGIGVIIGSNGQLGTVTSSARFKEAIKPMDKASEAILALKPVTFRYKHDLDPDGVPQFGLVAEQVEKVNPDLVVRDEDGKVSTVRYEAVNAMLLNEFLKEHRKVEEQQGTIAQLKTAAARQQKQIEALAATVQKVSNQLELNKAAQQVVANNQ
jgi:hypothetical protein